MGAGDFRESFFKPVEGDYVIAADAGYLALERLHYTPDVLLGDFDSLGEKGVDVDKIPGTYVIRLPKEKDDTDMLAAIREGMAQGYENFIILGATGGRVDHSIANMQCLVFLSRQNRTCKLYGDNYEMQVLTCDSLHLPAQEHGILAVFSVGDTAKGVTLKGLKYELEDANLTNDFPVGVSNEFTGQDVTIEVKKGSLLIIRYL
ncbi:MAG: thiamine diphosphokinase [Lachnospiraceae bacterium]|nr:thiamine diphosphokinase [Lachnospiraceae bacterium]